jgi:hypothetical protein
MNASIILSTHFKQLVCTWVAGLDLECLELPGLDRTAELVGESSGDLAGESSGELDRVGLRGGELDHGN